MVHNLRCETSKLVKVVFLLIGMGTIINIGTVLLGTAIGLLLRGGIPERLQKTVMSALGLSTIFIGITGALSGMLQANTDGSISSHSEMLLIVCMVLGALTGEAIDIESRLERFGDWCKQRLKGAGRTDATFTEAFMSASILFCVGAMAIVGALEDGLGLGCNTLAAKAVLDGVAAVIFSSTLGIGVVLSVLPLAIYQGGITALAGVIRPYMSDVLIAQMSFVGSVLIFAIGLKLLLGAKIKVGNLLPAMFFPILFAVLRSIWPALPF